MWFNVNKSQFIAESYHALHYSIWKWKFRENVRVQMSQHHFKILYKKVTLCLFACFFIYQFQSLPCETAFIKGRPLVALYFCELPWAWAKPCLLWYNLGVMKICWITIHHIIATRIHELVHRMTFFIEYMTCL